MRHEHAVAYHGFDIVHLPGTPGLVRSREDGRGQASCEDFLCHFDETAVSVKRHTAPLLVSHALHFIAHLAFIDIPSHTPRSFFPHFRRESDLRGTQDSGATVEAASAKVTSPVQTHCIDTQMHPWTSVRPPPLREAESHPLSGRTPPITTTPGSIPPGGTFVTPNY